MYTNFYVYTVYRQFMSGRLYWRIKKDGKWTWEPAHGHDVLRKLMQHVDFEDVYTEIRKEEEE